MNKTIEFVEKEILICNQNIDFQMQIAFESQENKFKKRYHENEALKLTEKLQMLHQIKAELEAWEVCKKYSHINNYNSNNKRFDISIWLNTENCDFKSCASFEECLKVKKALEIEDE